MKGKKLIIYTCISALVIALTFLCYFGFSSAAKTEIQNTSFVFIVISEVVFLGTIYLATRDEQNTFSRAGVVSASSIYIVISLILNIILKNIFETTRALITTNSIILILYLAIVLTVFLFKKEK